jgi:hypothetical protein
LGLFAISYFFVSSVLLAAAEELLGFFALLVPSTTGRGPTGPPPRCRRPLVLSKSSRTEAAVDSEEDLEGGVIVGVACLSSDFSLARGTNRTFGVACRGDGVEAAAIRPLLLLLFCAVNLGDGKGGDGGASVADGVAMGEEEEGVEEADRAAGGCDDRGKLRPTTTPPVPAPMPAGKVPAPMPARKVARTTGMALLPFSFPIPTPFPSPATSISPSTPLLAWLDKKEDIPTVVSPLLLLLLLLLLLRRLLLLLLILLEAVKVGEGADCCCCF